MGFSLHVHFVRLFSSSSENQGIAHAFPPLFPQNISQILSLSHHQPVHASNICSSGILIFKTPLILICISNNEKKYQQPKWKRLAQSGWRMAFIINEIMENDDMMTLLMVLYLGSTRHNVKDEAGSLLLVCALESFLFLCVFFFRKLCLCPRACV